MQSLQKTLLYNNRAYKSTKQGGCRTTESDGEVKEENGPEEMRLIAKPVEKLESIPLDLLKPELTTKIGSQLFKEEKEKLISFLKEYIDVFA